MIILPFRSAAAVLDATMNFNINLCANSDKKIPLDGNSRLKFPKSISCQNINMSIASKEIEPLEDEDVYVQKTVSHTYSYRGGGVSGSHNLFIFENYAQPVPDYLN